MIRKRLVMTKDELFNACENDPAFVQKKAMTHPELEHGRQDYAGLCDHDEQGAGGDLGSLLVQLGLRRH